MSLETGYEEKVQNRRKKHCGLDGVNVAEQTDGQTRHDPLAWKGPKENIATYRQQ